MKNIIFSSILLLIGFIAQPLASFGQCCTNPSPLITGPTDIAVGETVKYCTSLSIGGTYGGGTILAMDWNTTGPVSIVGADDVNCVSVKGNAEGDFCVVLTLFIKNVGCREICLKGKCGGECAISMKVDKHPCPEPDYEFHVGQDNGQAFPSGTVVTWSVFRASEPNCEIIGSQVKVEDQEPSDYQFELHQGGGNVPPQIPSGRYLICATVTYPNGRECVECVCLNIISTEDCKGNEFGYNGTSNSLSLDQFVAKGNYEIYTADGKAISQGTLIATDKIQLPQLGNGIYFIKFSADAKVSSRKFVIAN